MRQELRFVDASLALCQQVDDPNTTGWALLQRGLLAVHMERDPQRGLAYYESALEQFRRSESPFGTAMTRSLVGACWVALGEAGKAATALDEAYQSFIGMGNFHFAGWALLWLARVDEPKALQLCERALAGLRGSADQQGLDEMLAVRASILMDCGDNEEAAVTLRERLALLPASEDDIGEWSPRLSRAMTEQYLGIIAFRLGHVDDALRHHGAAFQLAPESRIDRNYRVRHCYFLAWYALVDGDLATAGRCSDEGLRYTRGRGDGVVVAMQLAQRAELWRLQGRLTSAARLAGAAATWERWVNPLGVLSWPASWVECQQALANVRAQVHDAGLGDAWAEGECMTLDQAVEYALQEGNDDHT